MFEKDLEELSIDALDDNLQVRLASAKEGFNFNSPKLLNDEYELIRMIHANAILKDIYDNKYVFKENFGMSTDYLYLDYLKHFDMSYDGSPVTYDEFMHNEYLCDDYLPSEEYLKIIGQEHLLAEGSEE